jgi:cysteine desulfurase
LITVIYLDNLATTPPWPEVEEAMAPYWGERFGNPTHLHQLGLAAAEGIKVARDEAASLLGCPAEAVTFVSSGTEAANTVLKGLAWKKKTGHLILTTAEHPSLHDAALFLQRAGFEVSFLPVDGQGLLDPAAVRQAIRPDTFLIATHAANHDSGARQDLCAIGGIAREAAIPFFVDASLSGGWEELRPAGIAADFLSLSPHRFHGPKGVGILYRCPGWEMEPLIHGGKQEAGRRAGTENVAAMVGAGTACRLFAADGGKRLEEVTALRAELWKGLVARIPGIQLNGPALGPERDGRHMSVSFSGVEAESLMLLLDLRGVAVTAASGCLGPGEKYSRVLRAMGLSQERIRSAILMAPGPGQTKLEMEKAVEIMALAVEKIRQMG